MYYSYVINISSNTQKKAQSIFIPWAFMSERRDSNLPGYAVRQARDIQEVMLYLPIAIGRATFAITTKPISYNVL